MGELVRVPDAHDDGDDEAPSLHPMELVRPVAVEAEPARDALRARVFGALFREPRVRRLGRYIVLDVVGEGGMGVVLKGYDDELDRTVAIKVLHGHLSERHRSRLRREARAGGR